MLPSFGTVAQDREPRLFDLGGDTTDAIAGGAEKVLREGVFAEFSTTIFSEYLDKIEEEHKKQEMILERRVVSARESYLEMNPDLDGNDGASKDNNDKKMVGWLTKLLGGARALKKAIIPAVAAVGAATAGVSLWKYMQEDADAYEASRGGDGKKPEPLVDPAAKGRPDIKTPAPTVPNASNPIPGSAEVHNVPEGHEDPIPGSAELPNVPNVPNVPEGHEDPRTGSATRASSLVSSAEMMNVSPDYIKRLVRNESNGVANAKNPNSSARGVGQFIDSTWAEMVGKYGARHNIGLGDRDNAEKNLIMTKYYAAENKKRLESSLGRKVTDSELYMGHFMGPAGATKFLAAKQKNPNASAVQLMGAKVANANKRIFYNENGEEKTISEVYGGIDRSFSGRPLSSPEETIKSSTKPNLAPPGPPQLLPNAKQPSEPVPAAKPLTIDITPQAKMKDEAGETPRTIQTSSLVTHSIASAIFPPKPEKSAKDATLPGLKLNEQLNHSNIVMSRRAPGIPAHRLAEVHDTPGGEDELMILPMLKTNTVIVNYA